MQGFPIKNKYYNGYSIVTNNKNVDATIEVEVTNAANKYIRIYGGELVGETQSA